MARREPLHPIDSDAVDQVAYDGASRTLTILYVSGGLYEYYDVDPRLYDALVSAQPHPWTVLGEEIKAHRFTRLS
jgi:hypothetical protein